jgi:hypothetical protein
MLAKVARFGNSNPAPAFYTQPRDTLTFIRCFAVAIRYGSQPFLPLRAVSNFSNFKLNFSNFKSTLTSDLQFEKFSLKLEKF